MRNIYLNTVCLFITLTMTAVTIQSCINQSSNNKQSESDKKAFEFKGKLSDYGFFEGKLTELQPTSGITKYELSTPLFTDYAIKYRFIALPKGGMGRNVISNNSLLWLW